MEKKRVLLTGGGTGGHITPNLALAEHIRTHYPDWKVYYVGSHKGMEAAMVKEYSLPFFGISCGKLRRYWDKENVIDGFRILKGIAQAWKILGQVKPSIIFSKGGYVSIPVVVAGYMRRIPIVIHESDIVPGLATSIGARFAKVICTTFPQTAKHLPANKYIKHTGLPLREFLKEGSSKEGYELTHFERGTPTMLVMGGSQGAGRINAFLWEHLAEFLSVAQVIHIVGKGNRKLIDWSTLGKTLEAEEEETPEIATSKNHPEAYKIQQLLIKQKEKDDKTQLEKRYRQYQFLDKEFTHIMKITDLVITRSGATSLQELASQGKPMVLIPLGKGSSRGDQIINAELFHQHGAAHVVEESRLETEGEQVKAEILDLLTNKDRRELLARRAKSLFYDDAAEKICVLLRKVMR